MMEVSFQELATIPFLALVAIWIFTRKSQRGDRPFLFIASLVYLGIMGVTIWLFKPVGGQRMVTLEIVLETVAFALVCLSRRLLKKKESPEANSFPIN
jgi:hypothetical protein